MSWQLAAFLILAVGLGGGFAWYERGRPDARVVALVGTLAAFAALGRIAFAAFPNVKPTTDIVLVTGYALGGAPGFATGAIAGLASNFFFGQGPWTPWQMAAWGVVGLVGAALALASGRRPNPNRWLLAAICGVAGFAFTAFQDFGDWITYSDHSLRQLGIYLGKGVGFDFVHAAGCVAFALAFGPALARSVARFALRLKVSWLPAGEATLRPTVLALAFAALGAGALLGAGSGSPAARAAVTPAGYLLAAQNQDGGFGPAPGSSSTPLYSGWAALGLAASGYNPQDVRHGGASLSAYLNNGEGSASDPGSLERTILALRAARLPLSGLVGSLMRDVGRNGSVSGQVNLTSFAVLALRAASVAPPGNMLAWLARQQDSDGGFNFATRGGGSDVDDTGAALEALAGGYGAATARAVRFLDSHQNSDGGYPSQPSGPSNAQSTAWAVQGLLAAGAGGGGSVTRALGYLRSLTAPDGHIRYSRGADETPVWVTAEALMALAQKPLPLAPVAAAGPAGTPTRTRASVSAPRSNAAARKARARPRPHPQKKLSLRQLATDLGAADALALAPIG